MSDEQMCYFDQFQRKVPTSSALWRLYDSDDYNSRVVFFREASSRYIRDFACGDGRNTSTISKVSDHAVGIDLSQRNIRSAKLYNQDENTDYIVCDGCKLPFRDEVFFGIVVVDALHQFRSPSQPPGGVSRVLDPENARLYIKYLLFSSLILVSEDIIRSAAKFIRQRIPEFNECGEIPHTNGIREIEITNMLSTMNFGIIHKQTSHFLCPYLSRILFAGPFSFLEKSLRLASSLHEADKKIGRSILGRFPRVITILSQRSLSSKQCIV